MANTQNIRGYVLNVPGGKPPWGTGEYTLLSNVISKLPDLTKYLTTQHLHTKLHDPATDTATGVPMVEVNATEIVVNESAADKNVRVETNGATADGARNMLFVDAGTNRIGVKTASPMGVLDYRHDPTYIGTDTDNAINYSVGITTALSGVFSRDNTYRNIMLSDAGTLDANGSLQIALVTRGSNSEGLMGFGCVGLGTGLCASAIFRFVGGAGGTGTVTLVSADANFQASDAGPGGNRLCVYFVAGSNRQIILHNRYAVTHKVSYWIFYNTGNLS